MSDISNEPLWFVLGYLFDEVDPIVRDGKEILDYDSMAALPINKDRLVEGCTTVQGEDGDDSEWEVPKDNGCAFMMMNEIHVHNILFFLFCCLSRN